jgi:hypothetical protein
MHYLTVLGPTVLSLTDSHASAVDLVRFCGRPLSSMLFILLLFLPRCGTGIADRVPSSRCRDSNTVCTTGSPVT